MKIQFLKSISNLELQNNEYVILGSAAAIANDINISRNNNDIDMVIKRSALIKLFYKNKIKKAKSINNVVMYTDTKTEKLDINFTVEMFSSFENVLLYSTLKNNFRFIGLDGLFIFYTYLWERFRQKKHFLILQSIKSKIVQEYTDIFDDVSLFM